MPKYIVTLPVTGIAHCEVEADSEETAIELALKGEGMPQLESWDIHQEIVSGNVFNGELNEATAELVDDPDL